MKKALPRREWESEMRKIVVIVGIAIFILAAILGLLRMVVGGGEDTWICVEGQWVKHGVPRVPMPERPCGK